MSIGGPLAGSLALSVHGGQGVIDLVVPAEASVADLAREYAAQCSLTQAPVLMTSLGRALEPDAELSSAGIATGDVLVVREAATEARRSRRDRMMVREAGPPGALANVWFVVYSAMALLAGWFGIQDARAGLDGGIRTDLVVGLLVAAAAIGVLPIGRFSAQRMMSAPVFAGSAAFVVAYQPQPERLPTVLGVSALVAAICAAVARSLDERGEESLRVWIFSGIGFFVVTAGAALVGLASQVVWAVLLLICMLAARFVPSYAVDVPDQFLIDIERLAVTAWSARARPVGRRGRTLVPSAAVGDVAQRGTRLLTAASAAVLVVAAVSAPMLLLATRTESVDRLGARAEVILVGAALLFAARSYRHALARAFLRAAGLISATVGLLAVLGGEESQRGILIAFGAIVVAALLVLVAGATGRGWRSAWWSRRAEVAEGLAGALAIASTMVAVGLVAFLWEAKFRV